MNSYKINFILFIYINTCFICINSQHETYGGYDRVPKKRESDTKSLTNR